MAQSRLEDILESGNVTPQSRVELLIQQLTEQIKAGGASPEEIKQYIHEYLSAHPEATLDISETDLNNMLNSVWV